MQRFNLLDKFLHWPTLNFKTTSVNIQVRNGTSLGFHMANQGMIYFRDYNIVNSKDLLRVWIEENENFG